MLASWRPRRANDVSSSLSRSQKQDKINIPAGRQSENELFLKQPFISVQAYSGLGEATHMGRPSA